ncbi:unnamed protein product [Prunus brigantina]
MKYGEDRWQLGEILESKHQDASDKECTPRRTDDERLLPPHKKDHVSHMTDGMGWSPNPGRVDRVGLQHVYGQGDLKPGFAAIEEVEALTKFQRILKFSFFLLV